jgi:predicted metal-dependent enzyme (double-stranded beta helix superfamily)
MSEELYSADQFVADAVAVLGDMGPTPTAFEAIGELMRHLARQPALLSDATMSALHGAGAAFTILSRGPDGSALMLARFPSESPTPIHDHNSWGVACVVDGRDRHIAWRRLDDGSVPARARIEVADDRVLGPGDVVWFGPPPQDVHSQQGVGGAALELVYFGADPNRAPRHYFDPERGLVETRAAT